VSSLSLAVAPPEAHSLAGLRVLAFCDYFTEDSSGGAERVALEVYSRLVAMGAEVEVVTAVPPGMRVPGEVDGIRVHAVNALDLRRVLRVQAMLAPALLGETARVARAFRPNVLHANSLHFQTTLVAAALRNRLAVPLVTTAHLGALSELPPVVRAASATYEHSLGRLVIRRSSRVIAVSEAVREHMLTLGARGDRCVVIPNGVDRDRFVPRASDASAGATPTVMFVGRLIVNKGPEVLLDALTMLQRRGVAFRAVYLGDGPMRQQLERQTTAAGLDDAVEFRGHRSDVATQLREADLVVRPSQTEGMPLTVLEAMATRICVVASDIPGNRTLIEPERNGVLVPRGDAGALADTLASLIADPARRRRLAAEGYRTALSHSWDACAVSTGQVLTTISAPQGASR